jgi:peptidoglycan/LPS O-acetylase OafA/YrhL
MIATEDARPIEAEENPSTAGGALRRMPQLDGLRAIAVLLVIWSHWSRGYKYILGTHAGFLGAQLFFVLSGYLISGILFDCSLRDPAGKQRWFILRQFYIRRSLRIFPLYYMVLGLAVLLNVPPFRTTWPWHAAYLSNVHYWMFGISEGYGTHLWSLSVEEHFYILWPILMLFLPKKSRLPCILLLIFSAPLFRLIFGLMHWGNDSSMAFWLTPGSLDSLGVGALLAYAERFQIESVPLLTNLFLGAGIAGYVAIHISQKMAAWDQTCCAFFFCWLVWKASQGMTGWFGALLECKPVAYLGRISYGVYVVHGFALAFWYWALDSGTGYHLLAWFHVPPQVYGTRAFIVLMISVITCGLAAFSFRYYESPINNLKRYFPYLKNRPGRREM